MSFLRSHGVSAGVGHVLGASLHIFGVSPEMYLAENLSGWLATFMPKLGMADWPPEWWPDVLHPRWMLSITFVVFWVLTMPSSREPDPLGDTGLDEQLQDAVTEFRLLRIGLATGYAIGFMLSEENEHGAMDWTPMLWVPASVVAVPIAIAIVYVLIVLISSLVQMGMYRLCGVCGPSVTAADVWGPSVNRRSAYRLLRRNVML